jgi:cytochrome c-type biogenesis protein CcmH
MTSGRPLHSIARGLSIASLLVAVLAPPAASAATPQASLPDIEDEVMCTICGTLLELSEAPQADRERALIRRLIDEGKTKDEIKDALVAEYGEQVLATPDAGGFDLVAWLIPAIALLGGVAAALAFGLRGTGRARRRRGAEPAPLDPSDSERLDADLARRDL